jgi:hypothetical protein
MPISAYDTIRDNNANIAPGNIRSNDQAQQMIVNSIRQLMADLAGLGITPFGNTVMSAADQAALFAILGYVTGTYIPTATFLGNVSALVPSTHRYFRVFDHVIIGGFFTLTPLVGGGTTTDFEFTLPIPSNFTSADQAFGSGADFSFNAGPVAVDADTATDKFFMRVFAPNAVANTYMWNGFYKVV